MAHQSEALVLRSLPFGEADLILHLLLPGSGRLTAIAKGARRSVKRFSGTLDLFQHLRVTVDGRRRGSMARLDQASLLRNFEPLRVDPARFALGCFLLELLDRLAPEGAARQDAERLFDFALAALTLIAERPVDPVLRTLLQLRALGALGLRPELRRCVRCRSEELGGRTVRFHVADGGPVCPRCIREGEGMLELQLGTLRALDQGLRFDVEQLHRLFLGPAMLAEARLLVSRFERFHVGVELRSERFLEEMLAPGARSS